MPVASQAGLITVRGELRRRIRNSCSGPRRLYDMVPQAIETARFNFVVPVLDLPIAIPVEVRTGSDYGLRFQVSEITQPIPLRSADLTFWGMPAPQRTRRRALPERLPGKPLRLRRSWPTRAASTARPNRQPRGRNR